MTNTALTALDDKPKRVEIRGKLRAALDLMVWEAMPYNTAAQTVGFTVASMRKALQRPHVLAYLRNEREVLRASLSPGNIHRLAQIRDAADNMPAVNAIKALEQLGDLPSVRNGSALSSPGLVIQIIADPAHMPHIRDITPKPLIDKALVLGNDADDNAQD